MAGKSTLNRLELSRPEPTRYHKIAHDEAAIERPFVELFLEAYANPPKQIVLDLDATDDPVHGHQEGRFFHRSKPPPDERAQGAYSRVRVGRKVVVLR